MSIMRKFVFPDTSIFLYFNSLDEIDLVEILQCDAVELVIAPVVLEELERQGWDHPQLSIRKRAEHSLRMIRTWMETSDGLIRPGVEMTLCQGARQETLHEYHLDTWRRDDLLMANVLEYGQAHGEEAVLLLTYDMRHKLKAHKLNLQTASLPAETMRPSAQAAPPGEGSGLRRDQATYPSRAPQVELRFENGSRMLEVRAKKETPITPELLTAQLDELRARCQEPLRFRQTMTRAGTDAREAFSMLANAMLIPEEEFERYRVELDSFLQTCETWLRRRAEVIKGIGRTVRLDFELMNSGGADADGLVLRLTLPKKLQWRETLGDDRIPEAPEAPQPPRTRTEIARESISQLYRATVPPWSAGLEPARPTVEDGWLIEGQELLGLVDACLQYRTVKLPPVYAVFTYPDEISNFAISYIINQRNAPEPVDGKLLVRVS